MEIPSSLNHAPALSNRQCASRTVSSTTESSRLGRSWARAISASSTRAAWRPSRWPSRRAFRVRMTTSSLQRPRWCTNSVTLDWFASSASAPIRPIENPLLSPSLWQMGPLQTTSRPLKGKGWSTFYWYTSLIRWAHWISALTCWSTILDGITASSLRNEPSDRGLTSSWKSCHVRMHMSVFLATMAKPTRLYLERTLAIKSLTALKELHYLTDCKDPIK